VGYLGEQAASPWWSSTFLGPHAVTFLSPVFGNRTTVAQYQGVVEAARRAHDEKIGVGRVFHLFRLPEATERRISSYVQDAQVAENMRDWIDSRESAGRILASLARGGGDVKRGPFRLGTISSLSPPNGIALVASTYKSAFQAGIKCYPYFSDR
jgi:hypothetical protein